MNHYKTLGLGRSATKEEIKEAFRRSALKFHPDRHSQSSKEVLDGAALKFKQASQAYEVLSDERKRADYDRAWRSGAFDRRSSGGPSSSSDYYGGRQYGYDYGYGGGGSYKRPPARGGVAGLDLEVLFRYMTTRSFLMSLAFASALLGGAVVIERSTEAMWKSTNSGKSFEDALVALEKANEHKAKGWGSNLNGESKSKDREGLQMPD